MKFQNRSFEKKQLKVVLFSTSNSKPHGKSILLEEMLFSHSAACADD